ncbi:MAG TPA: Crp/Fnr family transcriptional regulator [Bryobacteraceae bacterium]|nr:Crp/Fnr family transcriptional regulator [Bryobacteraceae bacterium]
MASDADDAAGIKQNLRLPRQLLHLKKLGTASQPGQGYLVPGFVIEVTFGAPRALQAAMQVNDRPAFDPKVFLGAGKVGEGRTTATYDKNQVIFAQSDPANAIFYIQKGRVKLTVVSHNGKEAVVAILGTGDFFGEGCLARQTMRMATAAAIDRCTVLRLEKARVIRLLHEEPAFSEMFVAHLLTRSIRVEEDLVDQLFNSSEKRLARVLLLLAHFGKEGQPEPVIAKISQETLAEMIGTTRSRVSFFMNKFRKLGFVDYNSTAHMEVHSSLLNVVLHD